MEGDGKQQTRDCQFHHGCAAYCVGRALRPCVSRCAKPLTTVWILDLEGDNLGTRKSENVFQIQSPVAIAVCVRYQRAKANTRWRGAHYTTAGREHGKRNWRSWRDSQCFQCEGIFSNWTYVAGGLPAGKTDYFLPVSQSNFSAVSAHDRFVPLQENGIQLQTSWPIGRRSDASLEQRWNALLRLRRVNAGSLLRIAGRRGKSCETNLLQRCLPRLRYLSPHCQN